jgi:hypothetical protein
LELQIGGLLVAPALDEDVENEALLVNRAPQPMLLPGDGDDDLIEVPFVTAAGGSPTDPVGQFPAEFQPPLPDRLVCTEMPRATASISSTKRRLNGKRKYSQTA